MSAVVWMYVRTSWGCSTAAARHHGRTCLAMDVIEVGAAVPYIFDRQVLRKALYKEEGDCAGGASHPQDRRSRRNRRVKNALTPTKKASKPVVPSKPTKKVMTIVVASSKASSSGCATPSTKSSCIASLLLQISSASCYVCDVRGCGDARGAVSCCM